MRLSRTSLSFSASIKLHDKITGHYSYDNSLSALQ
ncbi:hypothetical protein [Serratia sp. JKS296]